jgi:hypothetical protein
MKWKANRLLPLILKAMTKDSMQTKPPIISQATTLRRKISIVVVSVAFVFTAFALAVWFGVFTPMAPAGWSLIHAGMRRDDVLRLAGAPGESGWPENVVETWEIRGTICSHRLLIDYRSEERGVGHVQCLHEGTWLRGYGWLHPRIESQ